MSFALPFPAAAKQTRREALTCRVAAERIGLQE